MITLQVPILYGGFKGQERVLINGRWANVRPRVSQFFGETLQDYTRYGLPSHNGIDIITIYDDPILAMHDGVVIRDEPSPSGGNWIWLWNKENSFITVYMHNHLLNVQKGNVVKAGYIIALSDTTGNSTGNHSHIGVYKADAVGNIINDNPWGGALDLFNDPLIILKDMPMYKHIIFGKEQYIRGTDGKDYHFYNVAVLKAFEAAGVLSSDPVEEVDSINDSGVEFVCLEKE